MDTIERDQAQFLTVADTAALLRVCQATVRLHAEDLGGVRVGRQWRFPPDLTAPTLDSRRGYTHPTTGRLR